MIQKVICGGVEFHEYMCQNCKNYKGKNICKAFPDGIPSEIKFGRVKHTKPYDGDSGIVFEWKDDIEPYSFDDLIED